MAAVVSPTLGKLLTNVRNLLNQPSPSNSFWTDSELTEYINEAIRIYFAEVVQNFEGQFTTVSTLNITSGSEEIALPSDFFEIKTLAIARNNGYDMLDYRNNVTDSWSTLGDSSGTSYRPYYLFRGNNIVLRPVPNYTEAAALRLEYVALPDTLVNGGDSLTSQISPLFKQVIEMYAVYKAKLKESMVNGVNMHSIPKENLTELYTQFKECINKRSASPEYVVPFNP